VRVRGSPFFRTLMLGVGLLLAGWGILHLAGASAVSPSEDAVGLKASSERERCGFGLKLSAVAELVELKGRGGRVLFRHENSGGPFTGMIDLDGEDPVAFVTVRWKETSREGTSFAKLTLEPAGKPTLTHYFEAPGTIEDVWELPTE
jgi:hypothetical protein